MEYARLATDSRRKRAHETLRPLNSISRVLGGVASHTNNPSPADGFSDGLTEYIFQTKRLMIVSYNLRAFFSTCIGSVLGTENRPSMTGTDRLYPSLPDHRLPSNLPSK